MKAMSLTQPAPIESSPLALIELPDPSPGPGEVRLAVRCCAVCRTDLHIVEGDIHPPSLPIVPGHQIVGIVDRLGSGCQRLKLGMRVGAAWLRHTCGSCRFCRTERENLCPYSQYTGFHANGGFAEYAVVPEDFAYELPSAYDDISASPLLCAGIIGYRALKRCDLRPGGKLGIFGFGSSATIVLQIARHRGHEVYVISRSRNHQQLASSMGATWCGSDASKLPTPLDGVILFAPAGPLVLPALSALDSGGTLALAGIHMTPIPSLDYDRYLYRERDIHPVTANTRTDGRELLAEAAAAGVRAHTSVYSLKDVNRALQDMKADRMNGTGVIAVTTPA
ncbi:MAG TPA: zinc-dependent alcohol dehydrogenase family protein [Tepidisphaeraceae bacterium]|jgi:propanol-preferring alcohol dehydrogenase|nr:zinc-dependent alcohol dehydrogenase family protein [Tepidisphaeraceae bacterium]